MILSGATTVLRTNGEDVDLGATPDIALPGETRDMKDSMT